MRQNGIFLATLFGTFLLMATPACMASPSPQEVERFLQNVSFTESGSGAEAALKQLDDFLAKGISDPTARQKLFVEQIKLLMRVKRSDEAFDLYDREIATRPISPKTALELYEFLEMFRPRYGGAAEQDIRLIGFLKHLLKNPAIRKDTDITSIFYLRLANLLVDRRYNDQAIPFFLEAAKLNKNPDQKAEILFTAADAVRGYWDMSSSNGFLKEISKIDGISFVTKKRLALVTGENLIYPAEFDWTPSQSALDQAHKKIREALADRSPLQKSEEAQKVFQTLIRGEYKIGNLKRAIELGNEALENPVKFKDSIRGEIALLIAKANVELGEHKKAIRYYEIALKGSSLGPKIINIRIAEAAVACKLYTRAVEAYSEAISFCDTVMEKGLIKLLTKKITIVNQQISKNTKPIDSDRFFIDTDDELGALTLDEE